MPYDIRVVRARLVPFCIISLVVSLLANDSPPNIAFILIVLGVESLGCKNNKLEYYFSELIRDFYSFTYYPLGSKHIQGGLLLLSLGVGALVHSLFLDLFVFSYSLCTSIAITLLYLATIMKALYQK